ncbi:hypothetical protein [Streptomyces sp. NPDC058677]|uniref:hypothetical protein n=1 Tax=Streptomyces sp. NPDC058677 TaxID=3346594 RepID=UPI00366132A6
MDPLVLTVVGEDVVRRAVGVFLGVGVTDSRREAEAVGDGVPPPVLTVSAVGDTRPVGTPVPVSAPAEQLTVHRAARTTAGHSRADRMLRTSLGIKEFLTFLSRGTGPDTGRSSTIFTYSLARHFSEQAANLHALPLPLILQPVVHVT